MKLIYVAVCVLAAVEAASAKSTMDHKQAADECQLKEKATQGDMEIFKTRNLTGLPQKTKCLAACFFEKLGIIEDGKFSKEGATQAVLNALPPESAPDGERTKKIREKLSKAVDGCAMDVGEVGERCDMGFKILGCIMKYDKEVLGIQ